MVDPNPARGMPAQLQRYWLAGKGAVKIRWNIPGDFKRCVRALTKYFPKNPEGLCNILHTKATGGPPGHGSLEHSSESLVASLVPISTKAGTPGSNMFQAQALIAAQPALGKNLWAGPLAPIGQVTGEPRRKRQFEPGALKHRDLPLPLKWQKISAEGHMGSVTVGRILGITMGPDHEGNEHCWAWGDYLDEEIIPEAKAAKYLVDQGVAGVSITPGGEVIGVRDPATGVDHMTSYVIGDATLVAIPAFTATRLHNLTEGDWGDDDPDMDPEYTGPASGGRDCGCDGGYGAGLGAADTFAINPAGWRGLPLAPRDAVFDNDDAVKRIAAWAQVGAGGADVDKLRRAFMWRDSAQPETNPIAYRLPLGDIINGRLTLIFHAIYAAAALISGAHGGLPNVPEEDKNQLRNVITDIYRVMAGEFNDPSVRAPWDRPENEGQRFAMADNEPYGDVTYADPGYQEDGKKRYPIDTEDHVRTAWSYINQADNSGKYSAEQLAAIKKKIQAAMKKMGVGSDMAAADYEFSLDAYDYPLAPPADWFSDPGLDGQTKLTVTPEGRVFGHLAAWDVCHRDVTMRDCVLAPRSQKNYAPFHLGQVMTDDGSMLNVGKIVMDTRHADIRNSYAAAALHYDNTGDEIAIVCAGEDEYGLWVAGSVVPEASRRRVAKLRRSPLSGDWRAVDGHLELTAALAVNVPAFPVYAMDGAEQLALVAAGTVYPEEPEGVDVTQLLSMIQEVVVEELAAAQEQEDRAWEFRELVEEDQQVLAAALEELPSLEEIK